MSDEEKGAPPVTADPSAADLLKQIEQEKARELKAQEDASAASPASEPSPEPGTVAPDKGTEPAQESNAGAAPGPEGKDKPDWKKWAEKKGLLRQDGSFDVERSVRNTRELERELTLRAQGKSPQSGAPAQPDPSQPRWQPPYYPPPAQPNVQELAERYGLDPDDFKKVASLASDMARSISERQIAEVVTPLKSEVMGLRREVSREKELTSLKEDPAFHDPRVRYEMDRIMEENPSILSVEPSPWRYAFNQALMAIGRRIAAGEFKPDADSVPSGSPGSSRPPTTAGGAGGRSGGAPAGISAEKPDVAQINRLPAAEQRKILAQMGAVRSE